MSSPSSLSDATTVQFVGCSASDVLAPGGQASGYLLSCGIRFDPFAAIPPTLQDAAADLWRELPVISRQALVPQLPVPAVSDSFWSRFDLGANVTINAVTSGPAAQLTCAELVRLIGASSPLAVTRLERVSVARASGEAGIEARETANADAESDNPLNNIGAAVSDVAGSAADGLKAATGSVAVGLFALALLAALAVVYGPKLARL